MQTVRRLYVYGVTLISLETVLWGSIGLARSILAGQEIGGSVNRLAGALSLILVGVPVFLLHWWMAQRAVSKDIEERSSRTRAVFLYGALLATLIPVVQNILALASRSLAMAFSLPPQDAFLGGDQLVSDNLVAILLNLLFAAYIYSVALADWKATPQGDAFPEVRRLYRYIWMLYGLALLVFGVQQTLAFLLTVWDTVGIGVRSLIANGLAMLLIGAPLWVFVWLRIQASLAERAESGSLMRLVILYLLSFIGVGSVLGSGGVALYVLLRFALGLNMTFTGLLSELGKPLSVALSFGGVWAYYGRLLSAEIAAYQVQVEGGEQVGQRAAALRRLYYYVLALGGLATSFIGLQLLLAFLLDMALSQTPTWGSGLRDSLASALSSLLVGMPLWAITWRLLTREAALEGEAGDHARRSLLRKAYLYFVLFAAVMGVMFSAGALLFPLLRALLGEPPQNLLSESLQFLKVLILFALLLVYHWLVLRNDQRLAERSLTRRHAQFPVLVLAPDDDEFARLVVEALEREAAQMPVAMHPYRQGAPDETLSAAKAVILPAELAARPSEALRLWLQGYDGARLVVPTPSPGWHWVFGSGRPLPALARHAARIARHLAEGQDLPSPRETSPWTVLGYIMAGLIAFMLLMSLINLVVTLSGGMFD